MICWTIAAGRIIKPKSYLVTTWIPHMLLLVVPIVELNSTLLTTDILVHLKPLSITGPFHTDITDKKISTSHRVNAAMCVALCSELT